VGLIAELGAGPVAIDTAAFVYWIEEEPRYLSLVAELFAAIDAGAIAGATSTLTLLEVLVVPYRAGDLALAERYEAILGQSRGLTLVDLERPLLRAAAQLRAVHRGLRTPDALQLAAALAVRATAFVTNDRELPAIPDLRVVQLRDHLPRG
jgi:predicted nucleic acid-binding protein